MGMKISIIVPVYRVEEYLPRCLESLLSQGGAPFEVIAVDDGSPDACGRVLDAYAVRDSRLRVLHLERNGGLGPARAAGLREATGDYVWFVDGDDWLAEHAVAAVAERLAATAPDVLITDFVRSFPDGATEPNTWRALMADVPPDEVFTLRDRPDLLKMIMCVWNKVIRRDFLTGLDLYFGPGVYEDISVTYPLLLAAERLSWLDRVCYVYRRLRDGALSTSASPRHVDAFPQYDAIFAFLDRPGIAVPEELRRMVFDRTVRHAATIYGSRHLVPAASRPDFFRRMTEHFRRHAPAGHRFPRGPRGLEFRLLASGSYRAHRRLLAVNRLRNRGRSAVRGALSLRPRAIRFLRSTGRYAFYHACLLLPIDRRSAVYAAYWYRGYAGNPAAIYRKARELAPSVRGVWVVSDAERGAALPEGVPYVVENTPAYFKAMATAGYLVNNVNFPHTMTKRRGSVHVQTQHGTPLKKLGMDLRAHPVAADGMDFDRLLEHVGRWDYLVSPNPHATRAFSRAYPGGYEVLETGYPRNDRLVTATADEAAALRDALGVPAHNTVVLYAPTHRGRSDGFRAALDVPLLARSLGERFTLLIRDHYFNAGRPGGSPLDPAHCDAHLLDVSDHPSVEDLCLVSDLLVTDYSSLMFDYSVLDRPIVLFVPDWEDYRRVRGVYFDVLAEPPGPVAVNQRHLTELLVRRGAETHETARLRKLFRERFAPYDDGHAAERVVRRIFPTG